MRALITLILIFAVSDGYAATVLLNHMPLKWRPTSELSVAATDQDATPIRFEPFKDVRNDPEKIGENQEDDTSKPVTTADDVGAFVGTHIRELFDKAGLKTVDGDAPVTIHGEVRQFFARETSLYDASVEVQIIVTGRDGNTLWKGLASGEAKRFGRSYKIENYYEVLSDAVVNTVSSMLTSAQFRKALATH